MKIGVVLSGCGAYDGSEIHKAICIAPDIELDEVDHMDGP